MQLNARLHQPRPLFRKHYAAFHCGREHGVHSHMHTSCVHHFKSRVHHSCDHNGMQHLWCKEEYTLQLSKLYARTLKTCLTIMFKVWDLIFRMTSLGQDDENINEMLLNFSVMDGPLRLHFLKQVWQAVHTRDRHHLHITYRQVYQVRSHDFGVYRVCKMAKAMSATAGPPMVLPFTSYYHLVILTQIFFISSITEWWINYCLVQVTFTGFYLCDHEAGVDLRDKGWIFHTFSLRFMVILVVICAWLVGSYV